MRKSMKREPHELENSRLMVSSAYSSSHRPDLTPSLPTAPVQECKKEISDYADDLKDGMSWVRANLDLARQYRDVRLDLLWEIIGDLDFQLRFLGNGDWS